MSRAVFQPTDKISILGMSGCGKTTLSKKIQSAWPRAVVIDRMHEYSVTRNGLEHAVETFNGFCNALKWSCSRDRFRVVYQMSVEADNHDAEFNEAARLVYYRGSTLFVVEEVWNFGRANYTPKWLKEIVLTGRHRGVGLITTSQRPAEVSKTLLSQSQHIFCGQLHERNDIRYLEDVLGDAIAHVPRLKRGQFIHYRPGQAWSVVTN